MTLSKNLIVALLGLGCYARCNNINLANNTTVLLIILALLAKGQIDSDTDTDITRSRTTNTVTYRSTDGNGNSRTQTITTQPYNMAYSQPYTTYTTNSHSCPCNACNNCNNGFTTVQASTPFFAPNVMPFNTWGCPNCSSWNGGSWGNNVVY